MKKSVMGTLIGATCVLSSLAPAASGERGGDYVAADPVAIALVAGSEQAPVEATRPKQCTEEYVNVSAPSADEHDLACSAAAEAIHLLRSCRIFPRRPIQVRIMGEVVHPLKGAMFGFFDTRRQIILVTREANVPSLVKGTPYEELPQRDFYRSLIVHEAVHGVFHQNLKREVSTHAAYEYPAYALQIASLPTSVRERFLKSVPHRAEAKELVFNDAILAFNPFFFAAQAYEHSTSSGNGCNHLTDLLEGDVPFIPILPN